MRCKVICVWIKNLCSNNRRLLIYYNIAEPKKTTTKKIKASKENTRSQLLIFYDENLKRCRLLNTYECHP